jgi:hypothetical protein
VEKFYLIAVDSCKDVREIKTASIVSDGRVDFFKNLLTFVMAKYRIMSWQK